jgi:hypothetical protein
MGGRDLSGHGLWLPVSFMEFQAAPIIWSESLRHTVVVATLGSPIRVRVQQTPHSTKSSEIARKASEGRMRTPVERHRAWWACLRITVTEDKKGPGILGNEWKKGFNPMCSQFMKAGSPRRSGFEAIAGILRVNNSLRASPFRCVFCPTKCFEL